MHNKHMHIHTYAHNHSKGVFTDKELAIKAPCECDKSLKKNLRNKKPYTDHIYKRQNQKNTTDVTAISQSSQK